VEITKSKTVPILWAPSFSLVLLASRRGYRRRWRPADDGQDRKRTSTASGERSRRRQTERVYFFPCSCMNFSSFFRVVSCVSGVARGRMCVMGRLLVKASFVVLGCFTVMAGCMGMMLRSLLVVLRAAFLDLSSPWVGFGRPCVNAPVSRRVPLCGRKPLPEGRYWRRTDFIVDRSQGRDQTCAQVRDIGGPSSKEAGATGACDAALRVIGELSKVAHGYAPAGHQPRRTKFPVRGMQEVRAHALIPRRALQNHDRLKTELHAPADFPPHEASCDFDRLSPPAHLARKTAELAVRAANFRPGMVADRGQK